tara:strand:- start:5564 stop:5812 length:249 start_codon:yes stop_codon:yes gene_type:complete
MKSNEIKIFLAAWAQISLIVLNTWQIANDKYVGAVIVGFLISLLFTVTVRIIHTGTWPERIFYCLGGAVGTATGLFLGKVLY